MNKPPDNRFRETGWRRPLTDAEQTELRAWLAAHPEAQADWQDEAALNTILRELPEAPVPTNFTARVLQEIERDTAAESKRANFWRSLDWSPWLPRTAATGLAVVLVVMSLEFRARFERTKMGRSVAAMTAAPPPEMLKDFESIKRLEAAPVADKELLSLLR